MYSSNTLAENKPEDLYSSAKIAYKNNDCETVIILLTKYLKYKTNSSPEKVESVHNAVAWCNSYLESGHDIEIIAGVSPGGRQGTFYHENKIGAEMRNNKKRILKY